MNAAGTTAAGTNDMPGQGPGELREVFMPNGHTREVIYDAMTDQPGTRANGEKFGLRFRVLAVKPT